MGFTVDKRDDIVVVRVAGQLIVNNRQEFKQLILEALEEGSKKFIIDCTDTEYIDSSGLGVLVTLSKKITEADGQIRLAALNADLSTLFELTKLDTLFALFESVDAAADGF